jgi:hypothetical protein
MTTQQAQLITLAFLVTAITVVIAYDVSVCQLWGADATISRVMCRLFRQFPILYPMFWLAIGILIGHIGLPCE